MKATINGKEIETRFNPLDEVWLMTTTGMGHWIPVVHQVAEVIFHAQFGGVGVRYRLLNPPMYMRSEFGDEELIASEIEAKVICEERNYRIRKAAQERGNNLASV